MAPSDSVRMKIHSAIKYHLSQITAGSEYYNTIRAKNIYDPPVSLQRFNEYPSVNVIWGREDCQNRNPGSHGQVGGNIGLLHNDFVVDFDCVIPHHNDPALEQNKMLADIQKKFGIRYALPSSDGSASGAFNCFYASSEPWGTRESLTGITVSVVVWYMQLSNNPAVARG